MSATARPLAGFVFSRDQQTIDRFIGGLSYGGGAVNQVNIHLFVETMPFGGSGASGLGHYYGKYGFDTLTHAKSILISPPEAAIDHLYPPYTVEKDEALTLKLMAAQTGKSTINGVGGGTPAGFDPRKFAEHVYNAHTAAEDAGRIAAQAGVKMLVLNHVSPGSSRAVTDDQWIAMARRHFSGAVVVGHDGLTL
jgi:hypothetical protein